MSRTRKATSWFIDWVQGLDTRGAIPLEDLGLAHEERVEYGPSSWLTLPRIARVIPFSRDDVFIDFGSGKGRVVYMAALYYPFKRVIGVEISSALNDIARTNVERNRRRLRSKQVELVTSDALLYEVPRDLTIAYFFCPFTGTIFDGVLDRIRLSLHNPTDRRLWIIMQGPLAGPRAADCDRCNEALRTAPWLRQVGMTVSTGHSLTMYQACNG